MSRRRRRPDVGAAGAHTRVAWDRRPSAAGGEQDSLAQQGDGSVRCGGLQPFSDRGSPTIGSRRVGGGVSLWPSRVLLDQLRRLDQVSSANAWIRLGECLYRITLALVGPDELAARSLESEPVVGSWRTTHRFGSPQKRTPWLNREVLSCRWRLRRHLLQGIGCTAGSAKALLNRAMVGATGFEPVTSSVSANRGEALCYPSLSQVASDRRC